MDEQPDALDQAMEALRAGAAAFADDESLFDGMDLLQAIEHALAAYEQVRNSQNTQREETH